MSSFASFLGGKLQEFEGVMDKVLDGSGDNNSTNSQAIPADDAVQSNEWDFDVDVEIQQGPEGEADGADSGDSGVIKTGNAEDSSKYMNEPANTVLSKDNDNEDVDKDGEEQLQPKAAEGPTTHVVHAAEADRKSSMNASVHSTADSDCDALEGSESQCEFPAKLNMSTVDDASGKSVQEQECVSPPDKRVDDPMQQVDLVSGREEGKQDDFEQNMHSAGQNRDSHLLEGQEEADGVDNCMHISGDMTALCEILKKDARDALEKLAARENQLESAMLELHQANDRIETLTTQLATAKDAQGHREGANAGLRQEISALRNKTKEFERVSVELAEKNVQNACLMEEGQALSKQIAAMEKAAKKSKKDFQASEQMIDDLNQQISGLEGQLKTAVDRAKAAEERASSAQAKARTATDDQSGLNNKLYASEKARQTLEEKVSKLETELADTKAHNLQLQERLESSTSLAESTTKASETKVLAAVQQAEAAMEGRMRELVNTAREGQRRAEAESQRISRRYEAEVEDLRQQLMEMEERNQNLAASVGESTKPLLRQIDAMQSAQLASVKTAEELADRLRRRANEADSAAAAEKERAAILVEQVERLRNESAARDGRIEGLQSALEESRAENKTLRSSLEEQKRDEVSMRLQLGEMKSNLEQSEVSHQTSLMEIKSKLTLSESQVEQLRTEIEKMSQLQTSIRSQTNIVSEVPQVAGKSISDARSSACGIMPEENANIARNSNIFQAAEGVVGSERLRFELARVTNELNNLELRYQAVKAERDELAERMATVNSSMASSAELRLQLDTALELLGEKDMELDMLNEEFKAVKAVFHQQLQSLTATIDQN